MTSLTENILNIPRYLTVNNLIEHQIEKEKHRENAH
jgi:hypothetical protein